MGSTEPSRDRPPGFWRRVNNAVVIIQPWGILLAASVLVLSVAQFWFDYEGRVSERVARAWQTVTTAAPGNTGKRESLEYLNERDGLFCLEWLTEDCLVLLKSRTELVGIDLSVSRVGAPGVFLEDVDLRGAVLRNAKLMGADLTSARLHGAELRGANLFGAKLHKAGLTDTDLREANLQSADLRSAGLEGGELRGADVRHANLSEADLDDTLWEGADLSGAILYNARLRNANLRDTIGLRQDQLDAACGDKRTDLPDGLTIRFCE